MARLLALVTLMLAFPAQAVVNIDWVTVGDPGNACDSHPYGCPGAVAYEYRIGKYEVTNAQYAEFLNAVAATDTMASTARAWARAPAASPAAAARGAGRTAP